jgi:hypothetical protein
MASLAEMLGPGPQSTSLCRRRTEGAANELGLGSQCSVIPLAPGTEANEVVEEKRWRVYSLMSVKSGSRKK